MTDTTDPQAVRPGQLRLMWENTPVLILSVRPNEFQKEFFCVNSLVCDILTAGGTSVMELSNVYNHSNVVE